ncbi:MAG: hypothetical protein GXP38_17185 [Chloroflexi bacterium]|nr:hypothetical protein [Chloroflexota bacterium]
MRYKSLPSFFLLLLLLSVLAGCSDNADRLWVKAPGWSRAKWVGITRVGDPAPLVQDNEGNLYQFLITGEGDRYYPRLVAMNSAAEVIWDRSYEEIMLDRPDQPKLLWDGTSLRLFWLDRAQLYMAEVEPDSGFLPQWPVLLSGEEKVGSYSVAQRKDGAFVLWYAGTLRKPGLYAFPPGQLSGPAILIDPKAVRPSIAFDADNVLHAIWAHMPKGATSNPIFYAAYPQGFYRSGLAQEIAQPLASTTSIVNGPVLGLDASRVYVFWTIEVRTGMSAGSVRTSYVSFPREQLVLPLHPQTISVPTAYELPYQPVPDAAIQAGERVLLDQTHLRMTGQVTSLTASQTNSSELVVAHRVRATYLMRKNEMQVATLFFRAGEPHSYQLLSFTAGDSRSPYLFIDPEKNLYLTWLERGDASGFLVYLTSTAPSIRQTLSVLTQDDIARLTASTLFGLLTGIILIPFALMWFAVPLFLVAITSPLRREAEDFRDIRVLFSLVVSIAGYWFSKLIFLPGMKDYVPFTAWLPIIPREWYDPLRIGVPILISLFALWVAKHFTYDRMRNSPLYFILIFMAVDGVLTTAIYGVIFLATN